ncbi:MAG: sugar phosphate isomerase/epimerase [Bacillus subtilis]|nr:sugar phosphate isomerase/epimerase [Bacillus subtilis]
MLGSYFNPVHPDALVVFEGVENFKAHLRIAQRWNVAYVGTETGSFLGSPWNYTKENHTDAALEQVITVVADLVKTAQEANAIVAIEGAFAHVAYSPKRIKTILDRIASPHLKVIVDLYQLSLPRKPRTADEHP